MSEVIQIEAFNAEQLTREKLKDLIFYRKSFNITNVTDLGETVKKVEYEIEHQEKKLSCRVYTEFRSTAVVGSLWSPTALLGAVSAVAIGAHNLATWNPDYEIGKNYVTRTISVRYKK
ncbi:conserved hypothetical protein [Enterobacterales bacterium 8AC]|nr:conserved hypothetical protein [Enterobacterales bacterium 8AC]